MLHSSQTPEQTREVQTTLGRAGQRFAPGTLLKLVFDERTYLATYPDVAEGVARGALESGYDHYVRHGRWEGRVLPIVKSTWFRPELPSWMLETFGHVEARWRNLASTVTPLELAHRIAPGQRLPLPEWLRLTDHCMLELRIDAPSDGVPLAVTLLGGANERVGEPMAFHCRPGRTNKRLLCVSRQAKYLRLSSLSEKAGFVVLSFRLKPLREKAARRAIERRLLAHHPEFAANGTSFSGGAGIGLRTGLARTRGDAKASGLERRPLTQLWSEYESTFPVPETKPSYRYWLEKIERPLLDRLDAEAPERLSKLVHKPKLSILLPTFDTEPELLEACIQSVLSQSYSNFELCIVDDASSRASVRGVVMRHADRDPRVRVHLRRERGHICRASNDALAMASGEYVALLDHDDVLCRHALLLVAEAIDENPKASLLYSDEDKLDPNALRSDPHFKPDWDPELLLGMNYVGHLLVARTRLVRQVGGFRVGYEGSQDYDLVLRLTDGLDRTRVVHIPHVLYHWRKSVTSTAQAPESKAYTHEAGLLALKDALERRGEPASVDGLGLHNRYRVCWALPENPPGVSLIIPTRDAVDLLRTCSQSLLEKTEYPDLELLIVDNGSTDPAALSLLKELAWDPRVRVLRVNAPFNFSALNNLAAREARGSVLGLVNNDIEVIHGDWLREMVACAVRPEIGCVGAKLLYPDRKIQHAGVVLGIGGIAGHAFKYMPEHTDAHCSRARVARSVSAVTAACLVVKKRIYEQVGGLDAEHLAVAFNDVDFCLKVQACGYRNLFTPHATLIHHESATRGSDDDPRQRERFRAEQAVMRQRWGKQLCADPFYSPWLSLQHEDFRLEFRTTIEPSLKAGDEIGAHHEVNPSGGSEQPVPG